MTGTIEKEIEKEFEERYLKGTCFNTLKELREDKTLVEINAPRALIAVERMGIWMGFSDERKRWLADRNEKDAEIKELEKVANIQAEIDTLEKPKPLQHTSPMGYDKLITFQLHEWNEFKRKILADRQHLEDENKKSEGRLQTSKNEISDLNKELAEKDKEIERLNEKIERLEKEGRDTIAAMGKKPTLTAEDAKCPVCDKPIKVGCSCDRLSDEVVKEALAKPKKEGT